MLSKEDNELITNINPGAPMGELFRRFWLPVALQWNFFVHKRISVFGEAGLAIVHTNWSWARPCPPGSAAPVCEYRVSDTDFLNFVFYPGARFMLSDTVGLTLRIGYPHLTAGASFLF